MKEISKEFAVHDYYPPEINGSHLQGQIVVSYATLKRLFGEPIKNDGYKVDTEWHVMTPAGLATIYNWNGYELSNTSRKTITDWHIGGHNKEVVAYISHVVLKAIQ